MIKDHPERIELMVRGDEADQWDYAIAEEIQMSAASKRIAYLLCVILVIALAAFFAYLAY